MHSTRYKHTISLHASLHFYPSQCTYDNCLCMGMSLPSAWPCNLGSLFIIFFHDNPKATFNTPFIYNYIYFLCMGIHDAIRLHLSHGQSCMLVTCSSIGKSKVFGINIRLYTMCIGVHSFKLKKFLCLCTVVHNLITIMHDILKVDFLAYWPEFT